MRKSSLNIIELHIEKIVLGLTVLFTGYLVFAYLLNTPHEVAIGGTEVKPGEVDEQILQRARDLQAAQQRASESLDPVPNLVARVRQAIDAGLVGEQPGEAQPLEESLRFAGMWGRPIEEPGLADQADPGTVQLVTPLPPTRPVVETGRSRVVARPSVLGTEPTATLVDDTTGGDLREVAWVSVASYWDFGQQKTEHTKANYAATRTNPYVARIEAQRQELLPSGEWSEWQVVEGSEAMPQLDIPQPQYDEALGEFANRDEITRTFDLVKSYQLSIPQPRFYPVVSGDDWWVPPLPGYDEEAREEQLLAMSDEQDTGPGRRGRPEPPPEAPGRNQGPPPGMYGGGGGGGAAGPPGGMYGGGGDRDRDRPDRTPRRDTGVDERQRRRELQQEYAKGVRAFLDKQLSEARTSAQRIIDDPAANRRLKSDAEALLEAIKHQEQLAQFNSPWWKQQVPTPVKHPDNPDVYAVWYHDDTVQPGKTYRYRLRVRLWNRYVTEEKPLADPAMAMQPTLPGEWSLPSDPVTVPPSTYFFVGRRPPGQEEDTVRVEVWKWLDGWWVKESFTVGVGDEIGGTRTVSVVSAESEEGEEMREVDFSTGAVVLDIRDEQAPERATTGSGFYYRDTDSVVLLYYDTNTDQVGKKVAAYDSNNPIQQRLENPFQ